MRTPRLFPAALVALALLAVPSVASASSLSRSGGVYTYTGSATNNNLTITFPPGSVTITEKENTTMPADASCSGENTTSITCSVSAPSITADLGGGADQGNIS